MRSNDHRGWLLMTCQLERSSVNSQRMNIEDLIKNDHHHYSMDSDDEGLLLNSSATSNGFNTKPQNKGEQSYGLLGGKGKKS